MFLFRKKTASKATVTIDIGFDQQISRWFIFRFLWIVPLIVPLGIWCVWFCLLSVVHFFYMLLLGKRSRTIFNDQLDFIRYAAKWQLYLKYYVNTHPAVLPWNVK